MSKDFILLTGKNKFFGQTRKPWVSIDTDLFVSYLTEFGIKPKIMEFDEIANSSIQINNSVIFYTFSQKENYRNYIVDVMRLLDNGTNIIIPSLELLHCHENKGYQELFKKKIGLQTLKSFYLSSYKDIEKYNIEFPIVLKKIDGSNGKGVFLCKNIDELYEKTKSFEKISFLNKLDLFRRKYLRKKKTYKEYPNYSNQKDFELYKDYIDPEVRFVLQEYVTEQHNDFRVLVIHNKYFVMKRQNRENDFRASGSKKFVMDFDVDKILLNTAKSIYEKFDTPFLSMDFIFNKSKNDYSLIEFQALHFGISAIIRNKGFYIYDSDWEFVYENNPFEYELAFGLSNYLKEKNGIFRTPH